MLKIGMKIEVVREINCGIRVISIGEIAEITSIEDNMISIIIDNLGVGVFSRNEIYLYFKEADYIENKELESEAEHIKSKIKKLKKKLKKLKTLDKEIED